MLSTKAMRSSAAIAARSVRTSAMPPERGRVGVQPGHGHAVAAHVAAELRVWPSSSCEPVEVERRDGAHGLDERPGRLVAALAHDVVGLALQRVVDARLALPPGAGGGEAAARHLRVAAVLRALLEQRDREAGRRPRAARRPCRTPPPPITDDVDVDRATVRPRGCGRTRGSPRSPRRAAARGRSRSATDAARFGGRCPRAPRPTAGERRASRRRARRRRA